MTKANVFVATGAAREAWQAMADLVLDNERRREVSEQVGLSFGKIRALRRIASAADADAELAALLGVDPPNLTPVVDDLERAGLVERQPHPTDRRVKLVVATPEGTALAQTADEILARPPARLSALPADDLETLVRILARCSLIPLPTTERPRHPASEGRPSGTEDLCPWRDRSEGPVQQALEQLHTLHHPRSGAREVRVGVDGDRRDRDRQPPGGPGAPGPAPPPPPDRSHRA